FGLFSLGFGKEGWGSAAREAAGIVKDFGEGFDSGAKVLGNNVQQNAKELVRALPRQVTGFAQGFDRGIASIGAAAKNAARNTRFVISVNMASPTAAEDFLQDYGEWLGDQYKAMDTSVSQGIKNDLTNIVEAELELLKGIQRGFAFFGKTIAKGATKVTQIFTGPEAPSEVAQAPQKEAEPRVEEPEPETPGVQEIVPPQTPGVIVREVVREVVRETQVLDSTELALLKAQVAGILTWRGDIDSLKAITQKIQSSPPQSYAVNAPVYIGSTGIQVAGNISGGSIGATIGGVKDLGIGLSATIGETNNSASKLTVNAESFFNSPVKLTSSLGIGTSALTNLSIDTSGNVETKGYVKVLNSEDVAQITLGTNGNITITGTLTAQGGASVTGGTTTLSTLTVTGNTVLGDGGADTVTFNASTLSLPNSLNIDSATLYIDASSNRVGIGTVSPARILDVFGSGPQLRVSADASNYTDLSHTGTGFFTLDTTGFGVGFADGVGIGSTYSTTTPPTDGLIVQGNVGIGNTSPTKTLDVTGTLNTSGAVTFGSTLAVTDAATFSSTLSVLDTVSASSDALIGGNTTLTGDLAVQGGDITTTNTVFNLINGTATTVSFAGAATTFNIATTDGVTRTINLGTGTGVDTINIGTGATGADVIGIGSANAGNLTLATSNIFDLNAATVNIDGSTAVNIGTTADVPFDIDTSTLDIDSSGAITIDSTSTFSIDGVGASNVTAASGDLTISTTTSGNIILDTAGSITIAAGDDIVLSDGNSTIGSAGTRLNTLWADTVDATNLVGTVVTGSTSSATWTINSDNATADTEDANIAFERGTLTPNALITWDSAGDEFDFNSGLNLTGTIAATTGLTLTTFTTDIIAGAGEALTIGLRDNIADALDIQEGANNYINVGTLDVGAAMQFGNATTNPTFGFLGTGAVTIAGSADGTDAFILTLGDILVTNGDLDISGGDFNVTLDAGDTANITKTGASAGDVANIAGTSVNAINGLTIAVTSTADAAADANTGLNITWTESTDADTFTALNIGNTTTTNSATTGISIGTGWDTDINATTDLTIAIGGTNEVILNATDFSPATSDGSALGTTALMWGDLFLASGGVINFNNGDVTLTHAANVLTIAGGDVTISNTTASTSSTTGALTVSGGVGIATATTTATSMGLNVAHTGAITGTGYAGYFSKTGASTTNVGLYATASGATNNYAAIFEAGNVGIGTTSPSQKLTIQQDSVADLFGLYDGANNIPLLVADGGAATFKPAAFDKVYNFDGATTYTDNTTEAKTTRGTAFTLLADSNDYLYLGLDHKFGTVYFDIATTFSCLTPSHTRQYYNGSWAALTVSDNTSDYSQDGTITFTAPSDWATTAVNGTTKYWIRFAASCAVWSVSPTAYSVSPTSGTRFAVYSQAGDATAAFYLNDNGTTGFLTPYAQTLTVAKSGGDYTTIQAAINSITDAASTKRYLIRVMPGDYSEQVTMQSWVDIRGAGKHATRITFTGNNNGTIILASNTQLEDVLIEETNTATEWAIVGSSTSNVHIRNVDILGSGSNVSQGIKLTGSSWATAFIEHSVINYLGTTGFGIDIAGNATTPQNIDFHMADTFIDSFNATTGGSMRVTDTFAGRARSSLLRTSASGFNLSVNDTSAGTTDFLLDSSTLEFGASSIEIDAGATVLLKHSQYDSVANSGTLTHFDPTLRSGVTAADSLFVVGDGTGWVTESGNTARTSLGLGTGDSPTFTGLTLSSGGASITGSLALDGDLNFTGAQSISTTTGDLTINASGQVIFLDDDVVNLGTSQDIALVLNSAGLAANEELTDVIIGTSVTAASAANSLLTSNITASGDMAWFLNDGAGNSWEYLRFDGSADLTVFNEAGSDIDFRIESADNENVFMIDAALNNIGFGVIGSAARGVAFDKTAETVTAEVAARVFISNNGAFTTNTGNTSVSSLYINEPNITVGTATPTNSASLYIAAAATEATSNYALWVDAGNARLDGTASIGRDIVSNVALALAYGSVGNIEIWNSSANGAFEIQNTGASGNNEMKVYINGGATYFTTDNDDFTISRAAGTSNTTLNVTNTSNTAATAEHAIVDISVGGVTTTGDPQLRLTIPSGTSWYALVNNDVDDQFQLGTGTAGNTNMFLTLNASFGVASSLTIVNRNPGTITLASGATAELIGFYSYPNTINYTGNSNVTSLVVNNTFDGWTIAADGIPSALTVNKATAMTVTAPVEGTNVTLTDTSAIRILNTTGTP
ncbi:MAG: hypothetical protein Q7J73_00155, partial [Dehalococcoidales bacterium]|nr:hypothetical protein [Dehalococcoidales bacterium]